LTNNRYLTILENSDDFGFSFTDEQEIAPIQIQNKNLTEEITDLKNRLRAINSIFMPLLENLNREPDKAMIKWPNRKEVIDKQIRNLTKLTDV
jgi:hypothetical protein